MTQYQIEAMARVGQPLFFTSRVIAAVSPSGLRSTQPAHLRDRSALDHGEAGHQLIGQGKPFPDHVQKPSKIQGFCV